MLLTSLQIARAKGLIQEFTEEILMLQEELERDDTVLDHIGEKDYLTGEYNRRGFFARAYDYMSQQFKENTCAIVAYIDMDSLKSINELFGREEGNFAVKKVASLLHEVFGNDALLGRIRGDEFAILLVNEDDSKVQSFRTSMMQQNGRLMAESGKPYMIHTIFSICSFDYSEGLSLREMLRETDENLKKMRRLELDGINH
jgi:diguanylate cyclase (GGDEF)-like protein